MRLRLDRDYVACARLVKTSGALPAALMGGAMLGAGSAYGSGMLAPPNPYSDPSSDAVRAGAVGAGLGGLAYGVGKLPAWTVLPGALVAGGAALSQMGREPQGRPPQMKYSEGPEPDAAIRKAAVNLTAPPPASGGGAVRDLVKDTLENKAIPLPGGLNLKTLPAPQAGGKFKGTTVGGSLSWNF